MTLSSEKRAEIETAAINLGASRAAVFKWRRRGVPARWAMRIIENAGGKFSIADFTPPAPSGGAE